MRAVGAAIIFVGILCATLLFVWLREAKHAKDLPAEAQGSLRIPNEMLGNDIEDKAGVTLPFDVAMTDHDGRAVTLGEYFNNGDEKPVIMTLGYYGCPMLCSLVLNGLVEGLKNVNFNLGKDYRVVSVSIDDRETPELARKKHDAYTMSLLGKSGDEDWRFHVTTSENARRLGDAIGFHYAYDKKTDQFAHGAGVFVVTPKGVLARTLFGISFNPSDIKLALSEASDGTIGSFVDRVILSCFHYDPDSQRYGVYIIGVVRLSGFITMVILAVMLLMYFRGERKRLANQG